MDDIITEKESQELIKKNENSINENIFIQFEELCTFIDYLTQTLFPY